jgi:hypothetical protein
MSSGARGQTGGVVLELVMADFLFVFSDATSIISLGMLWAHYTIFLESVMDLHLSLGSGVSGTEDGMGRIFVSVLFLCSMLGIYLLDTNFVIFSACKNFSSEIDFMILNVFLTVVSIFTKSIAGNGCFMNLKPFFASLIIHRSIFLSGIN